MNAGSGEEEERRLRERALRLVMGEAPPKVIDQASPHKKESDSALPPGAERTERTLAASRTRSALERLSFLVHDQGTH